MNNYDKRRWEVERINNQGSKLQVLSGHTLVSGSGEIEVSLDFPITFIDKPGFTFGGELDEGSPTVTGSLPTVSAVVSGWETVDKANSVGYYYVGANVIIVVTGSSDQKILVHWRFEGNAMTNPISINNGKLSNF